MAEPQYTNEYICQHCATEFTGRKRKYCSLECQENAKRQKDRLRRPSKTGRARRQPTPVIDGKRECLECGETKPLDQFSKRTEAASGYLSVCRACNASKRRESRTQKPRTYEQRQAEYRARAEKAGREYRPTRNLDLQLNRLVEANAMQAWRHWLKVAPDWWLAAYWETISEPWRNPRLSPTERYRLRYNHDSSFQIAERLRRQITKAQKRDGISEIIRSAIRRNGCSKTVEQILGYSIEDLKRHIERQFTKGMTWEKFLAGQIHIDHIIPQADFNLDDDDEWKACWNISNLRPMWGVQNLSKQHKRLFLV